MTLAMVVCFIGFQGAVPQPWDTASAITPDRLRAMDAAGATADALTPTGSVGTPLLLPFGGLGSAAGYFAPSDTISITDSAQGLNRSDPANATGLLTTTSVPGNRPPLGSLFAPLDTLVPTSSFGFRTSPITGEAGEFHTGQDYAAPCGTAVHAVDAGTVRAVGWHQWGGGNRVEVDHGNGLITSYNHLEAISVKVGDTVDGGEPIATIGTTGSSTGCHLHFETILDGEHVDPLRWDLVPTKHTARKGELADYSPGSGASTVPAWAQSSTGSGQQAPAGGANAFGSLVGVGPGAVTGEPVLPVEQKSPAVEAAAKPTTQATAPAATAKPTAQPTTKPTTKPTPVVTPTPESKPTTPAPATPTPAVTPTPTPESKPETTAPVKTPVKIPVEPAPVVTPPPAQDTATPPVTVPAVPADPAVTCDADSAPEEPAPVGADAAAESVDALPPCDVAEAGAAATAAPDVSAEGSAAVPPASPGAVDGASSSD